MDDTEKNPPEAPNEELEIFYWCDVMELMAIAIDLQMHIHYNPSIQSVEVYFSDVSCNSFGRFYAYSWAYKGEYDIKNLIRFLKYIKEKENETKYFKDMQQ